MTTDRHCRKCGCELPGLFDYCPYCGEAVFSGEDKELFEVLRKLRLRLAKLEYIAPFKVLHDKTLKEIVKRRLASSSQLLEISGIGKTKVEKYGDFFLDEICKFSSR